MSCKHLFIGIGGSGIRTVAKVKYDLVKAGQSLEEYDFIFIDTCEFEIQEINKILDGIIDLSEVILFRQSYDATSPRAAFKRKKQLFKYMLEGSINRLFSIVDLRMSYTLYLNYWIVAGSCGSMGSGIAKDVIETINSIHEEGSYIDITAFTCLISYMPGKYIERIPKLAHYYTDKAKAFFNELIQVREDGKYDSPGLMVAIDSRDSAGNDLETIDAMCERTAELLSIMLRSRVAESLWSLRDIYYCSGLGLQCGPECQLAVIGFTYDRESAENVFFPLTEEGRERNVVRTVFCLGPPEEVDKIMEDNTLHDGKWAYLPEWSIDRLTYVSVRMCQSVKDYALIEL